MLYIGIDLGTSAAKLLLVDGGGAIENIVTKEIVIELTGENAGKDRHDVRVRLSAGRRQPHPAQPLRGAGIKGASGA